MFKKVIKSFKKENTIFIILNVYLFLLILIPKSFSTIFGIIPIRLLMSLFVILFFAYNLLNKKIKINKFNIKPLIIIFVLFIIFAVPSLFFTKNLFVSFYTFLKFILSFCIFIIFLKIKFDKKQYISFIKTVFVAAFLCCLIGIFEYIFSDNLFKIGIEKYVGSKGRIESTFFNTIYFGIFINIIFSYFFYLCVSIKEKKKSLIIGVFCSLLYICMLLTFTRSSILIFCGILFLLIILLNKVIFNKKTLILFIAFGIITFAIPGAQSLYSTALSDGTKLIFNINIIKKFLPDLIIEKETDKESNRDNNTIINPNSSNNTTNPNSSNNTTNTNSNVKDEPKSNEKDFSDFSLLHREEFAIIAKKIAETHKYTGVGFGAYIDYMNSEEFSEEYPDYKLSKTHPHSGFVLMNSEIGIISLTIFYIFFIYLLLNSIFGVIRNRKIKNEQYAMYTLSFSIIIGFFILNLIAENAFYDTQIFPIFLIVIGLLFNKGHSLEDNKKVLFISSSGGHLCELLKLKSIFKNYDYHIITEKTKSTIKMKKEYGKRINYLIFGSRDFILKYIIKFFCNCIISIYYFLKIYPKVIVTSGTHTAVPICYIGKLFGSKIIFIETYANSETKTLSGSIVYPIADTFIVQWKSMKKLYPKAKYRGCIH